MSPARLSVVRRMLRSTPRITFAVVAALVAITVLSPSGTGRAAAATTCSTQAKLVPSCGTLLGIHPGASTWSGMEQGLGVHFGLVKKYKDFSNRTGAGTFGTAEEKNLGATGHTIFYAWEARLYGARGPGVPAPAGAHGVYTYKQINSGQLDAYLDSSARDVKALGQQVFLGFNHEPDVMRQGFYRNDAGSYAGYAQAFRHIVTRFRAVGATNAVWSFVVSGFQTDDSVYRTLYPGDDVVDWVGWDPYQHMQSNWQPPEVVFGRFYKRLDAGLLGPGARSKPRMLGEYGCMPDSRRSAWFRAVPSALAGLPAIKAVQYFNSGTWGKFYPEDGASSRAFSDAAHTAQFSVRVNS